MLHSLDDSRKITGLTGDFLVPQQEWLATLLPLWPKRVTLTEFLVHHPAEVTRGCNIMFLGKTKHSNSKRRYAPPWKSHQLTRIYCQTGSCKREEYVPLRERTYMFNWLHSTTSSIHPVKQYRYWPLKYIYQKNIYYLCISRCRDLFLSSTA